MLHKPDELAFLSRVVRNVWMSLCALATAEAANPEVLVLFLAARG